MLLYGFWDRVEKACKDSTLTKKEICRRMHVDRKYLCRQGGGGDSMNSFYLAKFCAITGTSADWLLGLKRKEADNA